MCLNVQKLARHTPTSEAIVFFPPASNDLDEPPLSLTNIKYKMIFSFYCHKTTKIQKVELLLPAESHCRRFHEDLMSDSEVRLCFRVQLPAQFLVSS